MTPCILVFGMPRSGTTWVGKLFDSHPDTLYRHEPDSVQRLHMPRFPGKKGAHENREALERFVAALPGWRSPEVVGKQPLFPKSYQSAAALGAYRASVVAAKAASRMHRHFPCLYRPTAADCDRVRLVWKSIESSGRLGMIVEALPNTHAIHLMRHPCGYIASVLRGEAMRRFSGARPSADELWLLGMLLDTPVAKNHPVSLAEIEMLTPEERLAWRWVLTQEQVLGDVSGCDRVLTVRYEDICDQPLAMTRRMFRFTGLDWHPQTGQFVQASTGATHADYYSVYKSPQVSAGRWRSELPSRVVDRILRILRDSTMSRFYPDDNQTTAVLPEVMP